MRWFKQNIFYLSLFHGTDERMGPEVWQLSLRLGSRMHLFKYRPSPGSVFKRFEHI